MPDESYYKEQGEGKKWPKIVLIILGIAILALIILLLIKGCGKNSNNDGMERDLLEAGKEYYNIDNTLLPSATGECKSVTLGTLLEESLITTPDNYKECNQDKTYVKVCKLESGSYHYLPVMQCGSTLADDNFTDWKDGTESDLVIDKSDVRFTFKGEKLEVSDNDVETEQEAWLDELNGVNYKTVSSTKYYRYRDLTWLWSVTTKYFYPGDGTNSSSTNAYYISAPASGYTNTEGTTTGFKWYTEVSTGKVWQKTVDPTVTKAQPYQELCLLGSNREFMRANEGNCERAGGTVLAYTYTCDGQKALSPGNADTVCSTTCSSGVLNSEKTECGNMVESTGKKYYPSGSTNASGENTYYVSAPVSGAKKDDNTAAQVSKYFKTVTSTTSKYYATSPSNGASKVGNGVWGSWSSYQTSQPKSYSSRQIETRTKVVYKKIKDGIGTDNWVAISDQFLSEADLISQFQSLGYEVNTLSDIEQASDLRYQVKLQYRDRK